MKFPKAIKEFFYKMEAEGGLGGLLDYGIEEILPAIKRADSELGKALSNLASEWSVVSGILERKYPEGSEE